MRAKFIGESINFHKTGNVRSSLEIGKYDEVKKKLESLYGEHQNIFNYNIIDLNRIEVFYTKDMLEYTIEERSENPKAFIYKWILKYVESPNYEIRTSDNRYKFQGYDMGEVELALFEVFPIFYDFPKRKEEWQSFSANKKFNIGNSKKKETEEFGKIIEEAFLEKYGTIWSFDLVDVEYHDPR